MSFWHGFLIITLIHLLAAASPGPDFAMVTRESLVSGRAAGLLTSLGIALGVGVHVAYSAAGVAALVTHSAIELRIVKLLSSCFLLYLGISALRIKHGAPPPQGSALAAPRHNSTLIAKGFLCNLLNPKAPLYFLALFTAVIPATTPAHTLLIYGAWLVCLQWVWFAGVTLLFSHERIRSGLTRSRVWIERFFGLSMIAISLQLLWSVWISNHAN